MSKLKPALKENPSASPSEKSATQTDSAVDQSTHQCEDHDHGHSHSALETEIQEILAELDYVKLKEKRVTAEDGEELEAPVTLKSQIQKPKLQAIGNKLLGILGHCALRGHIAHFYNLRFEIEKHIKNIAEFEDPRFVDAYNYLKANPSTEAVFVYENKIVAVNRVNGRLIQKTIAS